MTRPEPSRPGSVDPSDVLDASRKVHSIGADLAASVIRRCSDKQEALDALNDARSQVCAFYRKATDGKSQFGGRERG